MSANLIQYLSIFAVSILKEFIKTVPDGNHIKVPIEFPIYAKLASGNKKQKLGYLHPVIVPDKQTAEFFYGFHISAFFGLRSEIKTCNLSFNPHGGTAGTVHGINITKSRRLVTISFSQVIKQNGRQRRRIDIRKRAKARVSRQRLRSHRFPFRWQCIFRQSVLLLLLYQFSYLFHALSFSLVRQSR